MGNVAIDEFRFKTFQRAEVVSRHNQSPHNLSLCEQFADENITDVARSPGDDYHLHISFHLHYRSLAACFQRTGWRALLHCEEPQSRWAFLVPSSPLLAECVLGTDMLDYNTEKTYY